MLTFFYGLWAEHHGASPCTIATGARVTIFHFRISIMTYIHWLWAEHHGASPYTIHACASIAIL